MTELNEWVILTRIQPFLILFTVMGLLVYYADVKGLRGRPKYQREAKFVKFVSVSFVCLGVGGYLLMHVLSWMV